METSEMTKSVLAIAQGITNITGHYVYDHAFYVWGGRNRHKHSTSQMATTLRKKFPNMRIGSQSLEALYALSLEANTLEDKWAKEIAKSSPNISSLDESLHNSIWDLIFVIKIIRKAYMEVL